MQSADARMRCRGTSLTAAFRGRNGSRSLRHRGRLPQWAAFAASTALVLGSLSAAAPRAGAQEMQWIWSPAQPMEKNVPQGVCYFRKSFPIGHVESAEIEITCDDAYELFVNGNKAGEGSDWRTLNKHDIKRYLSPGRNTIAIKATNKELGDAGLAARIILQEAGGTHDVMVSDATWRTSLKEFPQWTKHYFNDAQWLTARVVGPFGTTKPWLDEVQTAGGASAGRFQTSPEFKVETIVQPADTGSLIAITFNEFGDIIASREDQGILLIRDADRDGMPETPGLYCDKLSSVQGLLALNGHVFAVGKGDEGLGLYRVSGHDDEQKAKEVKQLLKFTGEAAEHGPHAVTLGPDGLLYVMLGNHTQVEKTPDAASPYHHPYEGDLFDPKYEDPRGHAAGIKAPGGTIVRTDIDGSFVELYAGGFRNAYDIAFNRMGDLFTYDSDMEWDMGTGFYRPTRVLHAAPGAEFGWRSGWSTWPEHFYDSLPALVHTGRGSPTGAVVYGHIMFPRRYHDALFVGDWARGRILALKMKPAGGTYTAEVETFATGKPLNVTDLEVGPDGGLYFCTGGRGTQGGVYRITWRGEVPAEVLNLGQGVQRAIRQPQLFSAVSRQKLAALKQKLGGAWDEQLIGIADNAAAPSHERARALNLMHLFGPFPTADQLVRWSGDSDPQFRAKTVYLMGLHPSDATNARLVEMLADRDPQVQRTACEALVRAGHKPAIDSLLPLLGSEHRFVAFAATRLLQTMPPAEFRAAVLAAEPHRAFLQGALALVALDADRETCQAVLTRAESIMDGFVTDPDFIDLLRLIELTLVKGGISSADVPRLAQKIDLEYPSKSAIINRELIRLMAYLQSDTAAARVLEQLAADISQEDKMHIALHARYLRGWSTSQKLELVKFFEEARKLPGGHSMVGYIDNVCRDFFADFTDDERSVLLAQGATWPASALAALAKLPKELSPETITQLVALDRQIAGTDDEAARRLEIGIVAVLGRSRDPQAVEYLHEVYKISPDRRGHIAMALTQNPTDRNWKLLVDSLPILDGAFAQQVLITLAKVDQKPEDSEPYRQVILRGLKLKDGGAEHAVKLLEKWTGQTQAAADETPEAALVAWQNWFHETYPHEPEAKLPTDTGANKWTYAELLAYLDSNDGMRGKPERGASVFAKAQCAACHRYGAVGESIGPDLSTVAQRFQRKEILESILFPSQVISDQYASKSITTADGRRITGLAAPQHNGSIVVLQTNGEKVTLAKDEIDDIQPSKLSAMPEGLLNQLTLEEIADLFAYLSQPPAVNITRQPGAPTSR